MKSQKSKVKSQKILENGFSMLELLIYMAIFSLISLGLINLISTLNKGWVRSQVESEVQQNLRYATNLISQDVKKARSVTLPTAGSSGETLDLDISGQSYQYFLTGTTLQKKVGAGAAEDITSNKVKVTDLDFYTFETSAPSNQQIQATTTQFYLKVEYNSISPDFSYSQSATSTAILR